jgi:hypothetical protein
MNAHAWPDLIGLLLAAAPILLLVVAGVCLLSGAVDLAHRRGLAAGSATLGWSWPSQVVAIAQGHVGVAQTCAICRSATELDDVAVAGAGGRCVCLRCFARDNGTERQMPAALRRALIAVLAEAPTP